MSMPAEWMGIRSWWTRDRSSSAAHTRRWAQGGIYRRFITGREQAVGWKL